MAKSHSWAYALIAACLLSSLIAPAAIAEDPAPPASNYEEIESLDSAIAELAFDIYYFLERKKDEEGQPSPDGVAPYNPADQTEEPPPDDYGPDECVWASDKLREILHVRERVYDWLDNPKYGSDQHVTSIRSSLERYNAEINELWEYVGRNCPPPDWMKAAAPSPTFSGLHTKPPPARTSTYSGLQMHLPACFSSDEDRTAFDALVARKLDALVEERNALSRPQSNLTPRQVSESELGLQKQIDELIILLSASDGVELCPSKLGSQSPVNGTSDRTRTHDNANDAFRDVIGHVTIDVGVGSKARKDKSETHTRSPSDSMDDGH